ncbi:CoA transferase [Micromonospora sp. R77]|nr:CoA transferase [Micromonospora sp. R77]
MAGEPLVDLRLDAPAAARRLPPEPTRPLLPAAGLRVLDLTRVIAGPVATRVLALLGADVLRVDDPRLPEITAQHLDTGSGKRSTLLDLRDPADRSRFTALLADADVLVTGYRPAALDRLGLDPDTLRRHRPDLVVARLSAWGRGGPWARRRGFDSLVQAATGIADVERRVDGARRAARAGPDHGTGYLLAAAVLRAVTQRGRQGGAWSVEVRWRVPPAGCCTSCPPTPGDPGGTVDPDPWCDERDSTVGRFRYARPPVTLPGGPATWATPPTPWGSDTRLAAGLTRRCRLLAAGRPPPEVAQVTAPGRTTGSLPFRRAGQRPDRRRLGPPAVAAPGSISGGRWRARAVAAMAVTAIAAMPISAAVV